MGEGVEVDPHRVSACLLGVSGVFKTIPVPGDLLEGLLETKPVVVLCHSADETCSGGR